MTPPDQMLEDLVVGNAIKSIDFDPVELQLPVIAMRAGRLRRTAHMKKAAIAGASLAVVIALVTAMTGAGAHRAVRVQSPNGRRVHTRVTTPASTSPHQIFTTTTAQSLITPPPADKPSGNSAVLPIATPATEPAPNHSHVSAPTTTREAQPSDTTPTTMAPSPYPPIDDGVTRMTLVLDDDGLHVPATFSASCCVEVLFLDHRTDPHTSFVLWGDPASPLGGVQSWSPGVTVIPGWSFEPGPVVFQAVDYLQTIPVATLTVTFTA